MYYSLLYRKRSEEHVGIGLFRVQATGSEWSGVGAAAVSHGKKIKYTNTTGKTSPWGHATCDASLKTKLLES